ncbi:MULTISPECIES: alpha/beta fold hydrolase [Gordonibacter]
MGKGKGSGRGKKVAMAVGIVVVVAIAAAAIALAVYVDGNRHGEERDLAKAQAAGFMEHQAAIDGATVNYAEGPNNGPAVLLVHGQGMQWEDYARVLPDLATRYHVFAVDCFGHGESAHDPALYSLNAQGAALKAFATQVIGEPYAVSGHSSGGIIAAWLAANDAERVTGCLLEDPPFFHVTPEEMQAPPGCFAWKDGFEVTHAFLNQDEVDDYAVYYAQHSYLFGLFGGLQPRIAEWTAAERAVNPTGHVTLSWVPRDWVRGMYFFDAFDPRFSEAFYTGTFFVDVDQVDLLARIECPTVYLKAETNYGEDGLLYAANTDEDAAHVQELVRDCETVRIKSGHDIHFEHPMEFAAALDQVTS